MPKYMLSFDKLDLLKPKGADKKEGFVSYNIRTDGIVVVETHEEYRELKDYLVK